MEIPELHREQALPALLLSARIEAAKKAAKEKDILTWGYCLFPEKFNLPFCRKLHDYFIAIRHDPLTDTEAPRNHAKTTIKCFLIPIFQALEEPGTFLHYLNVQGTSEKALGINISIRHELETNDALRHIYGDQVSSEKWSDGQFVLTNGTIFTAASAEQSIRGLNYRNIRPDYIIVDDLYKEEDINNPDSTLKKNAWFWGTLYMARAKSRRCSIHVQGTAINDEDLMAKMKKMPTVKSASFKAVEDWQNKVVLWPELNTFESLMIDQENMGSIIFEREMQNERRDPISQIIKSGWIQEYDPADLVFDLRYQYSGCVLGVDPSIGQKSENDYTAMVLYLKGRYADGRGEFFYIDQVWNEHISLEQRVNLMQRIQDMQPANRKIQLAYVEGIAGFKDFVAEARRRTTLPIREVDKVPDKITNLENKSKFFESKRVFINKNIEPRLKDMLIYQLTTNHPKHDDLRDAALLPLEMRKVEAFGYAD